MRKKILATSIAIGMLFGAVPACAATIVDSTANVYIDNKLSDIKFKNVDGYNYISVRDISEALDYDIFWYDASKTATVADSAHTLTFVAGKQGYYDNGTFIASGNTPIIIDDKMYVSFRDILSGTEVYFDYTAVDNTLKIVSNTYDANGKRIITSEEYASQYVYSTPAYTPAYTPSYSYTPSYQYYSETSDLSEIIKEAEDLKNQAIQDAAEAQAKVEEYEQQLEELNREKCEEACKQAYIEYMRQLKLIPNDGTETNKNRRQSLYDQYLAKVEYYENYYGV